MRTFISLPGFQLVEKILSRHLSNHQITENINHFVSTSRSRVVVCPLGEHLLQIFKIRLPESELEYSNYVSIYYFLLSPTEASKVVYIKRRDHTLNKIS